MAVIIACFLSSNSSARSGAFYQDHFKLNERGTLNTAGTYTAGFIDTPVINLSPFSAKAKKVKVYHPDSSHSPRKAVMRSLYFAGLGQIYNKHGLWWRLPLLYGSLGALAYNIYTNGKDYNIFLRESVWREQNRPYPKDEKGKQLKDPVTGKLLTGEPLPVYNGAVITDVSNATIYDYKDNLRRNRDLSIFSFIGVWGVNMIDAYVEAKFIHSFSMDNNLSFKITPSVISDAPLYASNFNNTIMPALKMVLLF